MTRESKDQLRRRLERQARKLGLTDGEFKKYVDLTYQRILQRRRRKDRRGKRPRRAQ